MGGDFDVTNGIRKDRVPEGSDSNEPNGHGSHEHIAPLHLFSAQPSTSTPRPESSVTRTRRPSEESVS